MARDTPVSDCADTSDELLPNLVTLVGRGVPSNFELAVDGEIELVGADPHEQATVISGAVAEGSIDVGVTRFRFSGQLTSLRLVDWNGVEAPESPSTPTVHVDYGVPERS